MIDLRSDTVTRPTAAMRSAMATAEVGDDVFGEDPTVRRLETLMAARLGKAAALFVSSGTMGNQLAIRCATEPGDEVIVGEGAHPVMHESGAAPVLSGVQFAIAGRGGLYDEHDLEAVIQPRAYWSPRTSLACVENTHNRAGGRVFPQATVEAIAARARARGLRTHLDGARLWNAHVKTGIALATLAGPFDTVTMCFSKGLGAPVGSILAGSAETIERARRFRKMWGGGMRQSGVLAAAALYAVEHHVERLAEDHAHAQLLATRLAEAGLGVEVAQVETNIVNIELPRDVKADDVAARARGAGVLVNVSAPHRLRAVTHLDVTRAQVEEAARLLPRCMTA